LTSSSLLTLGIAQASLTLLSLNRSLHFSKADRPMPHATRGRDGRQECRERGYYHLHRNLNNLLHSTSIFSLGFAAFTKASAD